MNNSPQSAPSPSVEANNSANFSQNSIYYCSACKTTFPYGNITGCCDQASINAVKYGEVIAFCTNKTCSKMSLNSQMCSACHLNTIHISCPVQCNTKHHSSKAINCFKGINKIVMRADIRKSKCTPVNVLSVHTKHAGFVQTPPFAQNAPTVSRIGFPYSLVHQHGAPPQQRSQTVLVNGSPSSQIVHSFSTSRLASIKPTIC